MKVALQRIEDGRYIGTTNRWSKKYFVDNLEDAHIFKSVSGAKNHIGLRQHKNAEGKWERIPFDKLYHIVPILVQVKTDA